MRKILIGSVKIALALAIFTVILGFSLWLYDRHLVSTRGVPTAEQMGNDPWRLLKSYPYSGNHMSPNMHRVGPMSWENQEQYSDFDVHTGDHGFIVDFDLENPPPKAKDEFRIVLVGGSGAQGWGARTNADMFHTRLQVHLNERFGPETKLKYTVINLAMAGAISYQNYVSLNIWGHKLEPDLIISYSGGNDIFVPMNTGNDAYLGFVGVANLPNPAPSRASRWFDENLPGIAAYTSVKDLLGINAVHPSARRTYLIRQEYNSARGFAGKDRLFEVALPNYVHALQSIKRDFEGIPMVVMFQAIDWRQAYPYLDDEYADFTDRVELQLKNHVNDRWYFIDYHQHWKKNKWFDKAVLYFGLHLTNELHELVAKHTVSQVPAEFWRREVVPASDKKVASR